MTAVDPNATEPGLLVQTLEIVQGLVDLPLSIDSSVTAAIEAGLKVAKGRPLVNSVTGEEEKLEAILPLVKKYDVPVVAISNDETGISMDPDVRFAVAKKIVERAMDHGIKPEDIVVDPLSSCRSAHRRRGRQSLPAALSPAQRTQGQQRLRPVEHLVRPSASHGINGAFIPMVFGAAMTSAIMNPCRPQEMEAVRGANVLNGTDKDCMTWIKDVQGLQARRTCGPCPGRRHGPGDASAGGRRRGGREARRAQG